MRLKIIINTICFLLLFVVIALFLSDITTINEYFRAERYRMQNLYKEPKNSLDVIFIGPSSVLYSWIPLIAWKNYGITSTTLAFPAFPNSTNKYYIKEVLKRQTPKVIIINIDNTLYEVQKENYKKLHGFLSGFKPSINKYSMINAMNKEYKSLITNKFEFLELYFPIIHFHNQWKEIPRRLIEEATVEIIPTKPAFLFDPFYTRQVSETDTKNFIEFSSPEILDITRDLFSYIKKENIPVIILNTPMADFFYNKKEFYNTNEKYAQIYKMADEYNIPYINFHCEDMIQKLNIKEEDLMDENHLNYKGAIKYTIYLSDFLQKQYKIKDKRGFNYLSAWNTAYKDYIELVKKKYNIDIENNLKFNEGSQ